MPRAGRASDLEARPRVVAIHVEHRSISEPTSFVTGDEGKRRRRSDRLSLGYYGR